MIMKEEKIWGIVIVVLDPLCSRFKLCLLFTEVLLIGGGWVQVLL